ncbi:PREDICTED: selenoprotein W [Haliaeetus leucocephalus]|uniref:selenoprotein W n=1 Tax=Haliaeetus leucocephalus TaxID=52644 RepID=UPI00053CE361|nr:PREDICTED: selenoprotein W [Haliaeetus leucocephalus]
MDPDTWVGHGHYQQLKQELERRFPGALQVSGQGTREVTGWFEVTVGGRLVHSKKNGDGFVDSDAKLQKIMAAIKTRLS